MKKIISLLLVIALTASIAVGGTLAYLQEDDHQVNTFTTGDVHIDLWEDFGDNTGIEHLIPAVGSAQDDTLKNGVEKEVYVTNTGSEAAYVRVHIAIPTVLDGGNDASANILHFNYTPESIGSDLWDWSKETGAPYQGDWNYYTVEIDGIAYNVYVVTYGGALVAGESTVDAMSQVYLDSTVTNETITELKKTLGDKWYIHVCAEGVQADGFENAYEALNTAFGVPGTYTADWEAVTGGKVNTTFVESESVGNSPVVITDEEGLKEVLTEENGVYDLTTSVVTTDMSAFSDHTSTGGYTVNGNGNTVTLNATSVDSFQWEGGTIPAMSMLFSTADGSPVVVNDMTITGTMQSAMAGNYVSGNAAAQSKFNTTFNNVNIVDAEVVSFSQNISPALCVYGTLNLNNCNVYGTTLSALDTDPMWPVYDMAVVNYATANVNGGKVGSIYTWAQAIVNVNNAEVDTIITAAGINKGQLTITGNSKIGSIVANRAILDALGEANRYVDITINAGATVNSLDLTGITNKAKCNIVIADGATVSAIIDDGVVYESIEAWKNA